MPRPLTFARHASLAALALVGGAALAQSPPSKPRDPTNHVWTVQGSPAPIGAKSDRGPPTLSFSGAFADGVIPSPGGPFGSELPSVVGAPFSAVSKTENITKLLDGNRIVQITTSRFYRDGQGRTRLERGFPGLHGFEGEYPRIANIYDPITGEAFMLNSTGKTATSLGPFSNSPPLQPPVKAPAISAQLSTGFMSFGFGMGGPNQGAWKTTELGEKEIDGIRVTGTRLEYTIEAEKIGNVKPIIITAEQWFSPDLGVVIQTTQRSPTGFESTQKLEQIQRSEPDRALFTVPPDYTKQDRETRGFGIYRLEPMQAAPLEKAK